jgi:ABC-type multidrug transport system permease subunit
MDKIDSLIQLVLTGVLFLCAVLGVVLHVIEGHLATMGMLIGLTMTAGSAALVRISWAEFKAQER